MNFIIEHRVKGCYVMETLRGVDDIDTEVYKDLLGIWVTDSNEETDIMEKELQEMRHARSSQPS